MTTATKKTAATRTTRTAKKAVAKKVEAPKKEAVTMNPIDAIAVLAKSDVTLPKAWVNKVVEQKGRQRLHFHTLGVALAAVGVTMLDKEGKEFNFRPFIEEGEQKLKAETGKADTQWANWFVKESLAFEAILSGKTAIGKYGRHAAAVISTLVAAGYSFK